MNTGQMFLAIGAMVLLSLTTLRINNHFVNSGISLDETKYSVLAVSLASSVIEEANNKSFDENTTDGPVTNYTEFCSTLGKESGESYGGVNDFDDFDDYNNYTRTVDSIPSATFKLTCQVKYINPSAPDNVATGQTWHKKISVFVTSPAMHDTIKMSSVNSYWYFR